MHPANPPPDRLPDPWLFDSEALLRELDRCRETVLQIPITNPNATHCGIQLAVSAIWNLSENLRYLLHLHREQQRAIRRQHEQQLPDALSQNNATFKKNIVPIANSQHASVPRQIHHHRRRDSRTTAHLTERNLPATAS